jgi:hypothetical protein
MKSRKIIFIMITIFIIIFLLSNLIIKKKRINCKKKDKTINILITETTYAAEWYYKNHRKPKDQNCEIPCILQSINPKNVSRELVYQADAFLSYRSCFIPKKVCKNQKYIYYVSEDDHCKSGFDIYA